MSLPTELEAVLIKAAERLDQQATLDTVMALLPWIEHFEGCPSTPCVCGLRQVLDVLRNGA